MTDTLLTWMSVLAVTALGALRAAHSNADSRKRRRAASRARHLRTSTQRTALPDHTER